jgi:hypothetical protein
MEKKSQGKATKTENGFINKLARLFIFMQRPLILLLRLKIPKSKNRTTHNQKPYQKPKKSPHSNFEIHKNTGAILNLIKINPQI